MRDPYEEIARALSGLARRHPEFRLRTFNSPRGPQTQRLQLLAIVNGNAVYRAKGAGMNLLSLPKFDRLPLCDRDGRLL